MSFREATRSGAVVLPVGILLDALRNQSSKINPKGQGNSNQGQDGGVPVWIFNVANGRAINASQSGQFLLGHASLFSGRTEMLAEIAKDLFASIKGHKATIPLDSKSGMGIYPHP